MTIRPIITLPDPILRQKARRIERVDADLRRLVRERIVAGDSDEAILAYLVARYGDNVLLRPPVRPATWPLWFGSACTLLIAGAGIVLWLRRTAATSARGAPPLAPEEERRLAALLDDDGRQG